MIFIISNYSLDNKYKIKWDKPAVAVVQKSRWKIF